MAYFPEVALWSCKNHNQLEEEVRKFRENRTEVDAKSFGGDNERYTWTQNDEECDVYFDVPSGTRSKDVECKFFSKKLYLKVGDDAVVDVSVWINHLVYSFIF